MSDTEHAAVVTIHYDLLAAALEMPAGTTIERITDWETHRALQIKVHHPDLPAVADGDAIPEATLIVRRQSTFETGWSTPTITEVETGGHL